MPDSAENAAHTTILGFSATPKITCPDCGATSYHPVDVQEGYCGRCHRWTGDPLVKLALVLSRVDARWTTFVAALADVMVARDEVGAAAGRLDVLITPLPELDLAVERLRAAAVAILLAADYHPFTDPPAAAGG